MHEVQIIIRKLRTERGLSQEQLGAMVRLSASSIGSYENGRLVPVKEIAKLLDEVLGGGERVQRAAAVARGLSFAGFLREWAQLEEQATLLRSFQLAVVPGLLQTPEYAERLLRVGRVDDLQTRLENRLTRQQVLTRADDPAEFIAVIDRSVLHRQVGTPDQMAEQLRSLAEAAERPNIWVHVVPSSTDAYLGLNGSFALATVNDYVLGYIDSHLGGDVISDPADVQILERSWEGVRSYALPVEESHEMILKAVQTWS
ncbi:helix-turn-helix domain-containing protein [Micromonospora sp. NBC_01813]|uniref:helix-turn-helix domain-containing protein n=1 Tax=Micromonospora sp. NBC_01813 TaxID=2975988 RepID=UPI002DD9DE91|nr:helix-turn-helix transcriptional regulator [Micromonospora sp. NBC_01813]WSA11145.1 helix-turn-helix transcriptional regulator [Micromonospora sp. NBC_01813]